MENKWQIKLKTDVKTWRKQLKTNGKQSLNRWEQRRKRVKREWKQVENRWENMIKTEKTCWKQRKGDEKRGKRARANGCEQRRKQVKFRWENMLKTEKKTIESREENGGTVAGALLTLVRKPLGLVFFPPGFALSGCATTPFLCSRSEL